MADLLSLLFCGRFFSSLLTEIRIGSVRAPSDTFGAAALPRLGERGAGAAVFATAGSATGPIGFAGADLAEAIFPGEDLAGNDLAVARLAGAALAVAEWVSVDLTEVAFATHWLARRRT